MVPFHRISGIGEVYLPTQFREIVPDDASLKLFTDEDLGQLNRIFNHLRRGGAAILSGDWEQVMAVMEYVERKQKELIRPARTAKRGFQPELGGKRTPTPDRVYPLSRLMCWADVAGVVQVNPPPDVPYLFELVGENPAANRPCPFLIPLMILQRIQNALLQSYPVQALGMPLLASDNVLPPRSQETTQLFQQGLQHVNGHLPFGASVFDLGCGCGCLSLLAAQELGGLEASIYASDLLPEAIATTRLNLRRYADAHRFLPEIRVMPAGDLFEPVSTHRFDLIIFNAPWVVARVRNRTEIAIHDEKQRTLRRFFCDVPGYLKKHGRVLIGYADASGPKAIANLEAMITDAGLMVMNRFKTRVATHRSKGKWENIMVYELGRQED